MNEKQNCIYCQHGLAYNIGKNYFKCKICGSVFEVEPKKENFKPYNKGEYSDEK